MVIDCAQDATYYMIIMIRRTFRKYKGHNGYDKTANKHLGYTHTRARRGGSLLEEESCRSLHS